MADQKKVSKAEIQHHWSYLKSAIKIHDISDKMIEKGVLTPEQHRELKNKHVTEPHRMEDFLYILFRKKIFPSEMFSAALIEAGFANVLDVLVGRTEASHVHPEETPGGAASQVASAESTPNLQHIATKLDEIQREQREFREETKHSLQQQKARIEQLTCETHALQTSVSELETTIKVSKISQAEIERELSDVTKKCRKLKEQSDFYRKELERTIGETNLESTDVLKTEMKRKDDHISSLKTQIEKKRKERDSDMSEIKSLNESLIKAEQEKCQLEAKCEDLIQKIKENEITIASLEEKIKKLRGWKS